MQSNRSGWRRAFDSNWVYLLIVIALVLLPHIIGWITGDSPSGLRGRPVGQSVYWQGILIEVFILAVLAMSYNLIFGFTGVISFGHALFFGLGGYIVGLMMMYTGMDGGTGLLVGIVAAVAICSLLGFLIGLVTLRLRGVYFTMFTLAIAEMFYIFFGRLPLTNAEDGFSIAGLPEWIDPTRNRLAYYYLALMVFVVTFLFIKRLMGSPTGAVLLAVRENEDRARTIGYNTLSYKLVAITLAGTLAAIAGILQVVFNKKVGPEILSLTFTVDPLLMTIIGGAGTFAGPVLGSSALHLSDRLLRDREVMIGSMSIDIGASWNLILGLLFIIVVMVFPYGIVGTWKRWRARRRPAVAPPSSSQPAAENA